jgi:histone H3/H4
MNPFAIRENQKKRKRLPGTNILLEIQTLQENPDSIIPQASFRRLVNEVCEDNFDEKFRWTTLSMKALQYSA